MSRLFLLLLQRYVLIFREKIVKMPFGMPLGKYERHSEWHSENDIKKPQPK